MNTTVILLLFTGIAIALVVLTSKLQLKEMFETQTASVCPISAQRDPDGRIRVQPGDKVFPTISDYVNYLSGLYAGGAKCIPPAVKPNRSPVEGILGGLGNGVESPAGVAMKSATNAPVEMTSAKTPINKLDDYEYSRVFEVERGSRNALEQSVKNQLLENRVLDWANLPFNAEDRAKEEDEFIAGRMESGYRDPKTGVFFKTMEGASVVPPDVEAAKLREQKILAAYRPTEISKHVVDNETEAVAKLVMKAYESDPRWEPVVSKVGENKWEVTELRPKPRKERYADETVAASMADADKLLLPAPSLQIDDRMRDDPYFDKSGVIDNDNKRVWNYDDFRKWTPGLERMFAPTADNKAWY